MRRTQRAWTCCAMLAVLAFGAAVQDIETVAADGNTRLSPRAGRGTPISVTLQQLAMNLDRPVFLTHAGDGSGRLFIVEKDGKIRIYKNNQLLATPFLDIEDIVEDDGNEQGLLSVAFHPDYETNGRFFVFYTSRDDGDNEPLTIAEYTATPSSDQANTNGRILLTISHPTFENHNGGQMQFGPDGYLYIGTGDGGSANDPGNNGQTLSSLLGKILRIDVDSGTPYGIPSDNPFVGSTSARQEIFAYGLRNPWRFSFDRQTQELYAGDVGQNRWEEIDIIENGGNYGWRVMEGFNCRFGTTGCDKTPYDLPIFEYDHQGSNGLPSGNCSITGGYVYRGTLSPSLHGMYIFADYCLGAGTLYAIRKGDASATALPTTVASEPVTSFGEDENGELYVLTDRIFGGFGRVYRIVGPAGGCALSCPGNIETDDADTNGSELVNYAAPTAVGDCGTVTCAPSSGSNFAVGVTTVTCTASSGDAQCVFTVTVTGSAGFAVTDATPASAARKASVTIMLRGSGFEQGATVSLGSKIKINSTTIVSPTRIDVQVKVKKKAARGARDIVVTNPGGVSATCQGCFTVE